MVAGYVGAEQKGGVSHILQSIDMADVVPMQP